jgi:hypothetical protein
MKEQSPKDLQRFLAALAILSEQGPNLGRPLVDSITGSTIHNLKELRLGANRILFAFSETRQAKLLFAGNKKDNWSSWYQAAIVEAERILKEEFQ